jgi:hypothetical protein
MLLKKFKFFKFFSLLQINIFFNVLYYFDMMTDPISHTQGYWVWLVNKPNSIRFNSYVGSKDIGSGSAAKLETLKIMLHIFLYLK